MNDKVNAAMSAIAFIQQGVVEGTLPEDPVDCMMALLNAAIYLVVQARHDRDITDIEAAELLMQSLADVLRDGTHTPYKLTVM